jgi:hypothetical protein
MTFEHAKAKAMTATPAPTRIYIASKTKHAPRWRELRDAGAPIISTWIDEAGEGESKDLADLWNRCVSETKHATALVLYAEPSDALKGAWIELGVALAAGVPVFAVGIECFTVSHHHHITHCGSVDEAFRLAASVPTPAPTDTSREAIERLYNELSTFGDKDDAAALLALLAEKEAVERKRDAALAALRTAGEALKPFEAFLPRVEEFIAYRVAAANDESAMMPATNHFRLAHFRNARAALAEIRKALEASHD